MNTLRLRIERKTEDGRIKKTHLAGLAVMHLDLVERLAERALRNNVRPSLVESIFEGGYIREDMAKA